MGGVEAGSWAGGWVARLPPTPTIGRKLAAARSWVWDQEVTRAGHHIVTMYSPGPAKLLRFLFVTLILFSESCQAFDRTKSKYLRMTNIRYRFTNIT